MAASFRRCGRQYVRSRFPPDRCRQPCGKGIKHSASLVTKPVAVQVCQLLSSQQLDETNVRAAVRTAMSAVYVALASLSHKQQVPHPSENTLKRIADALARKRNMDRLCSGGKWAVSLIGNLSTSEAAKAAAPLGY
eukprot:3563815-Pleurochrysis_carterae.AAC.2